MKRKVMMFAAALCAVFFCGSVFAAGEAGSKIGIVNLQKILVESKAGKGAKAAFEKELEAKRAVFVSKEKSARAAEEDLKAGGAKLSAEARSAKESKLAEDVKELRRFSQDMEEELKKKDTDLTSAIMKEVFLITQKIGDEGKYSIILQASPQVMYLDKATDITDEVIRRYDSGK